MNWFTGVVILIRTQIIKLIKKIALINLWYYFKKDCPPECALLYSQWGQEAIKCARIRNKKGEHYTYKCHICVEHYSEKIAKCK